VSGVLQQLLKCRRFDVWLIVICDSVTGLWIVFVVFCCDSVLTTTTRQKDKRQPQTTATF